MTEDIGLPVEGYTTQSDFKVALVNKHKVMEERILRHLDSLLPDLELDARWVSIARTHIEQGFMALNRAVFRPQRIKLEGDE